MALETYRAKRDFAATDEPAGTDRRGSGDAFVVQKHAARRLHYDLRLEVGDVLASWAVTRGPSLVPGEKRLAVHVEDHPLDYADFEGSIPKGEYGGGEVIVWDRGRWTPDGDPVRGIKKGRLDFSLEGAKLKGHWHLVRMPARAGEKRENWLLIKGKDAAARGEADPDILEEAPESVISGRTVEDIKAGKPVPEKPKPAKVKAKAGSNTKARDSFPGFVPPALATLKPQPPGGEGWLHEIKFDGYRLQAQIRSGKVKLLTRSGQDWTDRFGAAVVDALAALPARTAILDGELVVEGAGGASDFSALQADLSAGRSDRFLYYLFDALYLDGEDLRARPLTERQGRLAALLRDAPDPLRRSEPFDEDGEVMLRHACRLSLEGLVSKRRNDPYPNGRSRSWIKSKCSARQEFVVAGYVPSTVSSNLIGSLVLGYNQAGKLVHAGRVGTGFSHEVARDLAARLKPLVRKSAPFREKLSADAARGAVWVKPELVAEVEFRAWTADGILRHASFRGLREDKPAREIIRETPEPSKPTSPAPRPQIKLTHPDRIYWPDAGVTKQGLADWYAEAWPRMAPHLVNRPVALLRCPGGINGQCFFAKHAWKGQSREILTFHDPEDDEDEAPILAVNSLPGVIGLVQGGALEIHTWQSTLEDLEHPDQFVIDLDPGEGIEWPTMIAAAEEVRQRLEALGLAAFVKTSGGKGLHVVTPLRPAAGWDAVKGFTADLARAMAADSPDAYVSTITKSKRVGRILIDYLRNGRNNTAIAPYATRARPGAAVSMPLAWDELSPAVGADHFTVANAPAHLANSPDPWADFRDAAVPLERR